MSPFWHEHADMFLLKERPIFFLWAKINKSCQPIINQDQGALIKKTIPTYYYYLYTVHTILLISVALFGNDHNGKGLHSPSAFLSFIWGESAYCCKTFIRKHLGMSLGKHLCHEFINYTGYETLRVKHIQRHFYVFMLYFSQVNASCINAFESI